MSDDNISDALGLPPMPKPNAVDTIIAKAHDDSARNDFELARSNIHQIIQNGTEAIDKLSAVAEAAQHPRAYEVLAKLYDSILQANKDLLELQQKIREIDAADTPTNEKAQSVTNNLFVGTTSQLAEVINTINNKK